MDNERAAAKIGRPARVQGEKHTKEKIFEAASELFAKQGYDRTSIRQIAKSVGLTESAVYRHYPGKEAILEAIFAYAESYIFTPLPIEQNQGEYAGESIFKGLLLPLPEIIKAAPIVTRIARIMYSEMYHNSKIHDYFRQAYVIKADDYLEALFKKQIELGKIRSCDPRSLARIFNAFRSEWVVQNFIMENEQPLDVATLKKDLEAPIKFFEQLLIPARNK
jgi:AcrR family transcriptional regulator